MPPRGCDRCAAHATVTRVNNGAGRVVKEAGGPCWAGHRTRRTSWSSTHRVRRSRGACQPLRRWYAPAAVPRIARCILAALRHASATGLAGPSSRRPDARRGVVQGRVAPDAARAKRRSTISSTTQSPACMQRQRCGVKPTVSDKSPCSRQPHGVVATIGFHSRQGSMSLLQDVR
jgi:hypothetical protein